MLLPHVHFNRLGKSGPVVVHLLKSLCDIVHAILLSFVLVLPESHIREVLGLNISIRVYFVYLDELSLIFVELLHLFQRRVHACLKRPVNVHNSSKSTQLDHHMLNIVIFLNMNS